MKLKVLVRCEESQAVTKAFRNLGHEAYSNDILDCSGCHPEWHFKRNTFELSRKDFDITIAFPPCTDLAVSGAKWFGQKRNDGRQEKSIIFFLNVWKISDAVENPIGIMNTPEYLKKWFPELYEYAEFIGFTFKPTQIIQPWQFGDPYTKTTCLWLRNLPPLLPTQIVDKGERHITKSGKSLPDWYNLPPSEDRGKLRSKTFPGIADAMAKQWSEYILNTKQTNNEPIY